MASVDVKVTNKSGRTVGLRLPEGSKMLAHIRKRVRADDLVNVEVTPTPQPVEAAEPVSEPERPSKRDPREAWEAYASQLDGFADPSGFKTKDDLVEAVEAHEADDDQE